MAFFLLIPTGWGEVTDLCSQKEVPGANFWDTPLCLTHLPLHSNSGDMDKSDTTICFHGPLSSTDLEISVPSKPKHFNEPWPTGMTEPF